MPPPSRLLHELQGYEFTEELHRGRSTVVFRGTRKSDSLAVVVKALNGSSSTFSDSVRLHHEHAILSAIHGTTVIRCYGLEKQNRVTALVLEDSGGVALGDFLASTRLDIPGFLRIGIQLATALQEIHGAHVIHLDINPSNIIVHPRTLQIKVIDFGISSRLSLERVSSVSPNVLEGTLPYISPEQTGRMNRPVDYRADFYSLGVTLYEALIGWVPFQSTDSMELLHSHIAKTPPALAELNAAIPRPVSDIVMKLLAKTAEERYQSSAGLRADLERCAHAWENGETIPAFSPGDSDISERFQIPQKLYGREAQSAAVLEGFERACQGPAGVLLVSGAAGIGKSALVHEVHKPIVRSRGLFISGKFDQFRRDVPYAFLSQALREFIDQLLASNTDELNAWRIRLQGSFGPNGGVLTRFIPEIDLIVGEQPPLQDLPPKESQNRFNGVIQGFMRAASGVDHPLVLFLDDLQWADQASLDLIQQILADPGLKYFFLICAFREEEVREAHPLTILISALSVPGISTPSIALPPLDLPGILQLIGDTLRLGPDECRPLAALVAAKTAGNPFFVNEFLKSLYKDELLRFDQESRRWVWDMEEIRQKDITENVVTMMATNIGRLPVRTQESLPFAACIGNTFHLDALAGVLGRAPGTVAEDLWPAIRDGLIVPQGDSYKYLQSIGETGTPRGPGEEASFREVTYRFAHDRVQQAAYSLIPPGRASRVHYDIGRTLLGRAEEAGRQEDVFASADHLNLGREHILGGEERGRVMRLNLSAGRRAKASAAYGPALRYFAAGFGFVSPEDGNEIPELVRDLLMEKGECEYLTGDFVTAERSFDEALHLVSTPAEKGRVYALKIELFIHRGQLDRALAAGIDALKVLGVGLPFNPGKAAVFREMAEARARMGSRRIPGLIDLPAMRREEPRVAMNILMSLFGIAYSKSAEFSGLVVSKMMNLTLRHGNADVSSFTYGIYGLMVSAGFRAYAAGHELGRVSLRLSELSGNRLLQGRCNFVFGCLHNHWHRHARTNREYLREAFRHATESGDLLYASYVLTQESIVDLVTGVPLPVVLQNASEHLSFVRKIQHEDIALYFEATAHLAASLMDATGIPGVDGGSAAPTFAGKLETSGYGPPRMFYYFTRAQFHYFRGEYDAAAAVTAAAESLRHNMMGQLVEAEYLFFHTLTFLALAGSASRVRRKEHLRRAAGGWKTMRRWAELSPDNFRHKLDLLAAELARVEGRGEEAMRLYDSAIAGAGEQGFVQHEGLANERAGDFHYAGGRPRVASSYLTEARACYEAWGATGLVRSLEVRYPGLLQDAETPPQPARGSSHRQPTTTRTGVQSLDLISVLKASQALSGEILLPRLLDRLMQIVLENAGAQRGFLIMEKEGGLVIEAEGGVGMPAPVVLQSEPVEGTGSLSESIVRYVARLRESVVLDDAGAEGKFSADPYVLRTHPKSILCMPIMHQGKLSGILYLENNLSAGVFTPGRLEVLRLLSSQIAVSMENARLYAQERELVRMQEEFRLAAKIQQELLPNRPPALSGYEIFATNIPARAVGGDYFDFIRIDDRHMAICIGDVSGKGLPASLLMANLQASLRGQSVQTLSPRECLARSNRLLFESTAPEKYATVFYGILDTETHRLHYCNGGHEHPLLVSPSGECTELVTGGVALGLLESFAYEEAEVPFMAGGLLVLYSDGITEAMDEANEQFSRAKLEGLLVEERDAPLDVLGQKIVSAVKTHAGSAPQSDDITLVAIRRGLHS